MDTRLGRVHTLVGTLLLAVKLLLLCRGGCRDIKIRAQALLLAATLSVHTVGVRIAEVGHSLLIL